MPSPKKKAAKKLTKKAVKKSPAKKDSNKIKKASELKSRPSKAATKSVPRKKNISTGGASRSMTGLEAVADSMDLNITFKLGLGEITATHFHDGNTIEKKKITKSGIIHFDGVEVNDVISINGACSGTCTLISNRQTDPVSDASQPRSYNAGSIFDNLVVE